MEAVFVDVAKVVVTVCHRHWNREIWSGLDKHVTS